MSGCNRRCRIGEIVAANTPYLNRDLSAKEGEGGSHHVRGPTLYLKPLERNIRLLLHTVGNLPPLCLRRHLHYPEVIKVNHLDPILFQRLEEFPLRGGNPLKTAERGDMGYTDICKEGDIGLRYLDKPRHLSPLTDPQLDNPNLVVLPYTQDRQGETEEVVPVPLCLQNLPLHPKDCGDHLLCCRLAATAAYRRQWNRMPSPPLLRCIAEGSSCLIYLNEGEMACRSHFREGR